MINVMYIIMYTGSEGVKAIWVSFVRNIAYAGSKNAHLVRSSSASSSLSIHQSYTRLPFMSNYPSSIYHVPRNDFKFKSLDHIFIIWNESRLACDTTIGKDSLKNWRTVSWVVTKAFCSCFVSHSYLLVLYFGRA